jgi:hypothetical protein
MRCCPTNSAKTKFEAQCDAQAPYYGNLFYGFLPVVQKISLVMCPGWMLSLHYTQFSRESGHEPSASA